MQHGITFRGRHSREFNTVVKTVGRPIIAPVKQIDEEVQYRDGNIDCSETGGRLYYEDKVLELDFYLISPNTVRLQMIVSKLANWLAGGYGKLIFDDMPTIEWIAKPVDIDNLEIELYKNGHTKVQFRCRPFNSWIYDSTGIPLDSDIILDSDIPLNMGDENEISFNIGNNNLTMNYYGSAPLRPACEIILNSGVNLIDITINGVSVRITPNGTTDFIIDCENGIMPLGADGDFFELLPGENTININSIGGSGMLKLIYNHKFLYGGDF